MKEYKYKPISATEEIISKYKDIRTGRHVTSTVNNIKESINYLKNMTVERAGKTEYAIRFYDINYKTNPRHPKPNGQFLFKTFSSYTNRESLALPPSWNQMTGIKQWQLKPETIIFKGTAAPQRLKDAGYTYSGGAPQIFIYQPWNYKTLLEVEY